jgi:hypothetical protein
MVLATSNGASPTPPYSGYHYAKLFYMYRALTFFGLLSHAVLFISLVDLVVL